MAITYKKLFHLLIDPERVELHHYLYQERNRCIME